MSTLSTFNFYLLLREKRCSRISSAISNPSRAPLFVIHKVKRIYIRTTSPIITSSCFMLQLISHDLRSFRVRAQTNPFSCNHSLYIFANIIRYIENKTTCYCCTLNASTNNNITYYSRYLLYGKLIKLQ